MKHFVVFMILVFTIVYAQDYSGSYALITDPSTVLSIQTSNGRYTGTLSDSSNGDYHLEGILQGEYLEGYLTPSNPNYQKLVFVISVEGDKLILLAALMDENGQPDRDSAQSFEFVRKAGTTTTEAANNPLSTQANNSQNPLGGGQNSDPFSGFYKGNSFNLQLNQNANGYSGIISMNGQQYPLQAQQQNGQLVGEFTANGQNFSFTARLGANKLTFISDGQEYILEKQGGNGGSSPNPNPLQQTRTSQAGTVINLNQQYSAGTRLFSPATGVSFTVPQGYQAFYDPKFQGFLMKAQDNSNLILVEAVSTGTAEDLGFYTIESLASFISPNDPRFQTIQGPGWQGNILLASFVVADGTTLSGAARSGEAGNAAVAVSYGQDLSLVSRIAESFDFTNPQADIATMQQELAGAHLYHDESSDKYMSAPLYSSSTTVAGNSKFAYDFCSDGRFKHDYDNVSYISVNDSSGNLGMIGQTGDRGSKQGRWQLVSLLMGNPLLVMNTDGGEFLLRMLEKTNNGIYLDGVAYQVSQSEICR